MMRFALRWSVPAVLGLWMGLWSVSMAFAQAPDRPEASLSASAGDAAKAVPTEVVVRAIAQDAKVIQSSVGGAHITIRNAETGDVLAEGIQEGGSGSTDEIMRRPHRRNATPYATEDAARFTATLALSEPTRVEVVAEGPLDYPQARQRAQTTLLLVPGQHIRGDGIVLPLRGFIVELLSVGEAAFQKQQDTPPGLSGGSDVRVRARARMLCGCPTTPGGLWDSRSMQVQARLIRPDGTVASKTTLAYAGTSSTYEGVLSLPEDAGTYDVQVLAMDAEKTNFGRVRRRVSVE